MAKQLLTHSRQDSFKTCRRKHYYSYELMLRKKRPATALRMGTAYHNGVEALGLGHGLAIACQAVVDTYGGCPDGIDELEWSYEVETVRRMICGYDWRWGEHNVKHLEVEKHFEIPLVNPKTGKSTANWNLAGKIDAIVELEDGRLAVKETKLFGDDIGTDSPLWMRMRMDHQVSLYIYAARRLGYQVDCVLYDVARKPTIKPTLVPDLDENGLKIVLDANGERVYLANKKPRQSADKEAGQILSARPMSTEEWGEKLGNDIGERPDYYFNRVEVARLDHDIEEYMHEIWDLQQAMRDAQKNNRWYRTVNKNTCQFCEYFNICSTGQQVTDAPEGFEILSTRHPELEKTNGSQATSPAAIESTADEYGFADTSYF